MQIGFELPNRPDVGLDTWEQVDALRSSVVKVRPYHLSSADTIHHIQRRGLAVLLRHDADGEIDVPARVRELSRAAWTLREHGIGDITIIIDNEPNHTNGGPDTPCPPDYWQKVSQVVTGLYYGHFDTRPLAGTVRYASPPMAVAQGEAAWYESGRDIIPAFDVVCVHVYGQTDNSLVTYALQLASVFGKPMIADEVGNTDLHLGGDNKAFAVASYARQAAEAGVVAATIFIAKDPTPEWTYCTLPTDKLGMIADAVAAVIPEAPATIPQETPQVSPHEAVHGAPQPEASPVREWTREEIIDRVIAYSDAAGVPRRLTLACGIAESNLRQFATREGVWPDVSYGIGQQIVLYAPVGNGKNTPENRALVKQWLYDPENAIPLMVGKLAANYDNRIKAGYSDADAQMLALAKYNSGQWTIPSSHVGNYENYRRGFVQADAILATWEAPVTPEAKATITTSLHKLWALASAFEQNADQPNADYIKAEVARIKEAIGIQS